MYFKPGTDHYMFNLHQTDHFCFLSLSLSQLMIITVYTDYILKHFESSNQPRRKEVKVSHLFKIMAHALSWQ